MQLLSQYIMMAAGLFGLKSNTIMEEIYKYVSAMLITI